MSQTDPSLELIPAPGTVVELVRKLVDEPRPGCDEERENLFARLGFTSGDRSELVNDESPHQITELDVDLGGQPLGSWDTYNGQFLGLTLHLYSTQESGDPGAQSGFHELRIQLTELFGKPEHPWDGEETPPCIWNANGWTITTHLFNRRDSSVMLSVADTALSAVAEADAISG
ncbi:hypothetical protein M2368_000541 [Arthrobacter sp. JUb119]|uniref:hypothetical protein n=1 Tax=Glutamicibacter sp. NPDC087583 TaxID=3363995 RepID=UPI002A27B856|nr:hypothetical protein [Arthrobacter sp. JUb119]